jgi:SRSO17 transposase
MMRFWSLMRPDFSSRAAHPAALGRQYTGSAGKITNCQIGVFAALVSRHGHAFIDRALYLPKAWTDDRARMAAAYVPEDTGFATKPRLAGSMIKNAVAAKMPVAWVAADSVYGVADVEKALRYAGKGYVLGVNSNHLFQSWLGKPPVAGTAQQIAGSVDPSRWQRLLAGEVAREIRTDR